MGTQATPHRGHTAPTTRAHEHQHTTSRAQTPDAPLLTRGARRKGARGNGAAAAAVPESVTAVDVSGLWVNFTGSSDGEAPAPFMVPNLDHRWCYTRRRTSVLAGDTDVDR